LEEKMPFDEKSVENSCIFTGKCINSQSNDFLSPNVVNNFQSEQHIAVAVWRAAGNNVSVSSVFM
jgi:hypothetical protein